jgi:hypothetical protein
LLFFFCCPKQPGFWGFGSPTCRSAFCTAEPNKFVDRLTSPWLQAQLQTTGKIGTEPVDNVKRDRVPKLVLSLA